MGWVTTTINGREFVAHMENILDVYKRPYDPDNPAVCIDESPKQRIETCNSTPAKPGQEEQVDYEYIRHGVVNIHCKHL